MQHDELLRKIYEERYVPTEEEADTLDAWNARRLATFGVTPRQARDSVLRAVAEDAMGIELLSDLVGMGNSPLLDETDDEEWEELVADILLLVRAFARYVIVKTGTLYPLKEDA